MSKTRLMVKELEEIFAPVGAGPAGTGTVLTSPSSIDGDIAKMVADEMDLDGIYQDFGSVVARRLADELEKRALKPSDYARIPELLDLVTLRVAKNLKLSEVFARAFLSQLGARG